MYSNGILAEFLVDDRGYAVWIFSAGSTPPFPLSMMHATLNPDSITGVNSNTLAGAHSEIVDLRGIKVRYMTQLLAGFFWEWNMDEHCSLGMTLQTRIAVTRLVPERIGASELHEGVRNDVSMLSYCKQFTF